VQKTNRTPTIGNQKSKKLPRSFFLRPAPQVAQDLLGKYLVRHIGPHKLIAQIVETEAYRQNDPASHSFRGLTKRNEVMFLEGGHLYVYFTYGMHFCANVVTGMVGSGEAVLLRAAQPINGVDQMERNRRRSGTGMRKRTSFAVDLTNGPAKLCQALKIGRKENGIDLLGDEIYLLNAPKVQPCRVAASTRIGIRVGTTIKWRFYVKGNGFVSR
jgi:DNA-3-methyladenine glycosylase